MSLRSTCTLLVALVAIAPIAQAAPPAAAREIEQLIASLGQSGCDFERNGSWHASKKAEEHLRRKYVYLRDRDKIGSAEQFIALAGTQSSMSGRTYRVRCPGKPVVDAGAWLRTRLLELRETGSRSREPR